MDVSDRIQRRRNGRTHAAVVVDWDALNPAYHTPDPAARVASVESVLDAVDPAFEDELPQNLHIWGEAGTGKSAICTAIMSALKSEFTQHPLRYTSTRTTRTSSDLQFVYVDGWRANTQFKLYHQILDALRTDRVPKRGIGTEDLRNGIASELNDKTGLVLAIDHVSMAGSLAMDELESFLSPLDAVRTITIGRDSPEALEITGPVEDIHLAPYSTELVDVLALRASQGLSRTLEPPHLRRIAEWADGNAHDALAALYLAGVEADQSDASRIHYEHVSEGIEAVPRDGTSLSHLMALPETEQALLKDVIDTTRQETLEIECMSHHIAEHSRLTDTTVKRLLYELAQDNVLQRTAMRISSDLVGRRPSQVEPNFSVPLFEHVRDA